MSSELIGKTIGTYKITGVLGRGGMATVYRGYQENLDREVAIKTLSDALLDVPGFSDRFVKEARALAKLSHPAILPIYDFGESDGVLYMLTPLMSGGSLINRMHNQLPAHDVVRLLAPIADALDFAHAQGFIHRDVKPNNILFDQHGNPFLADFGIAKMIEGTTSVTGSGIVGTPDYMSPEQGRGETLDHRTDIYSLGVIAYQLLSGQPLFTSPTPIGLIFKHISESPRPLQEGCPDLPEGAEQAVMKALAKDREARWQTAREFIQSLATAIGIGTDLFTVMRTIPAVTHTESPTLLVAATPNIPLVSKPPKDKSETLLWRGFKYLRNVVGAIIISGFCVVCSLCGLVVAASAVRTPTPQPAVQAVATLGLMQSKYVTATPPRTPAPTSKPISLSMIAATWSLRLNETFDSNASQWETGVETSPQSVVERQIVNGKYRWAVNSKGKSIDRVWSPLANLSEFYLAVDIEHPDHLENDLYGLTFLDTDKRFYTFGINQRNKTYSVYYWRDGEWAIIILPTESSAIRTVEKNRLAVLLDGSYLTFYINDQKLDSVQVDSAAKSGRVGLFIEADKNPASIFLFDNFETRIPPSTSAAATPIATAATPSAATTSLSRPSEVPASWKTLKQETFDSPDATWAIGTASDQSGSIDRNLINGKYRWEITTNNGEGLWTTNIPVSASSDYYVAMDVNSIAGGSYDSSGIYFRLSGTDFYLFAIEPRTQQYYAYRWRQDKLTFLVDRRYSPTIKRDDINRIGVLAQGSKFTFFANGQRIADAQDATLSSGGLQIRAHTKNTPRAIFEFDNIEVSGPPSGSSSTLTPTQLAALTAPTGWSLELQDSFDADIGTWDIATPSPSSFTSSKSSQIVDGKYKIQARTSLTTGSIWYTRPSARDTGTSFYLASDFQQIDGTDTERYGMIFLSTDPENLYLFNVADSRKTFEVYMRFKGSWSSIVPSTFNAAIRSRDVNRLAVLANNSLFKFYINGQEVYSVTDTTHTRGRAGIAVTSRSDKDTIFLIDNFELRAPPVTNTATPTRTP